MASGLTAVQVDCGSLCVTDTECIHGETHTKKDFLTVVKKLRSAVPDHALSVVLCCHEAVIELRRGMNVMG